MRTTNSCGNCSEEKSGVSRRDLLRTGAIVVGTAGAIAASLVSREARAQTAKISQADAQYQATPKGDQICANCAFFAAPSSCGVVDGTISPSGWCKLYQKKG